MFDLPLIQAAYLAGVICAFLAFGVVLAGASLYVRLGERQAVPARRNAEARLGDRAQATR